jgi:hypothetical protein
MYDLIIVFKIPNMIVRAQINDACSRASKPVEFADNLTNLDRLMNQKPLEKLLIICNLSEILPNEQELKNFLKLCQSRQAKILGKYPHISNALKERAVTSGVDYAIPNSSFARKLEDILSGV